MFRAYVVTFYDLKTRGNPFTLTSWHHIVDSNKPPQANIETRSKDKSFKLSAWGKAKNLKDIHGSIKLREIVRVMAHESLHKLYNDR